MTAKPARRGFLVAVEGIDGCGKSSVAQAIAERLRCIVDTVQLRSEPTAGVWGRKIRQSAASGRRSPQNELDWFVRDRRQHIEEVIAPALARGEIVVLDRYYPSTVAYQAAAGLDGAEILQLNAFAPAPDICLVLDIDPATALERIRLRGRRADAFERADTLAACRATYLSMPLPGRVVIDAARPLVSVLDDAWAVVRTAVTTYTQHA